MLQLMGPDCWAIFPTLTLFESGGQSNRWDSEIHQSVRAYS
jgi:hypothetical protein